MIKVKICGITNYFDANLAQNLGADALGFVFYRASKRCITPEKAAEIISKLNPFSITVGVFVDEKIERINTITRQCKLDFVQIYGYEKENNLENLNAKIIKSLHFNDQLSFQLKMWKNYLLLIDSGNVEMPGGTGNTLPWFDLKKVINDKKIILAGGLTPDNVRQAIDVVQPYAVDVSTGVENSHGKKNAKKMEMFIKNAKGI